MKALTESEKAYIAGIVDGEGSIMGYRHANSKAGRGYSWRIEVTVSNTNYPLIEWLHEKTGLGKCKDGYVPKNPKHKPAARWAIYSKQDTAEFLSAILPYLQVKRRNAELALEFAKLLPAYGRSEFRQQQVDVQGSIVAKLKELNTKGPNQLNA